MGSAGGLGLPIMACLSFFLQSSFFSIILAPRVAAQSSNSTPYAPDSESLAVSASCAHAYLPNVIKSCYPSQIGPGGNISNNARLSSAALLQACIKDDTQGAAPLRPLRIVGPESELFRVLSRLSESTFSLVTGVPINFSLLSLGTFASTRQSLLLDPVPPTADRGYDALLASPTAFGDAAQVRGKLLDLSYLVTGDKQLDWAGIQAQFKSVVAYDGAVVAFPLVPAPQLQYYHRGIFERDNLSVPQTWDEFADLAERYHGRDGMLGACIQAAGCRSDSFTLRMIFGSYVLTHGQAQGMFWDAESLEPLVNSPAMEAALKIFRRLRAVGPNATGSCLRREYVRGTCLLSINAGTEFKVGQLGNGTMQMRGRMGMALMPGSTQVLDRRTMTMQPCSPERCPLWSGTSLVNGEALLVNRPITSATSIVLINGLSPPAFQFYVYNLFSWLSSPGVIGTAGLLTNLNELLPVREQDMADSNVPAWVAAGYVEDDARRFLSVYRAMAGSVNVNADLKIRLTTNVTAALLAAALSYTDPSRTPDAGAVMAGMEAVLNAIVAAEGGKAAFARQYRGSINWSPSSLSAAAPPPAPPEDHSSGSRRGRVLALSVALPCGGALLVLLLVLLLWAARARRRGRGSHGARAPGVGSGTTLCVTDIQDSTVLWECVAAEHMDAALKIHHRVIREALLAHGGYESATEGDSFILAFFQPLSALLFAMEAQQALLDAPWPPELLQHAPLPDIAPRDDPAWELVCWNRPPQRLPRTPSSVAPLKPPGSAKATANVTAASCQHLSPMPGGPEAEAATRAASALGWNASADTSQPRARHAGPRSQPAATFRAAPSTASGTQAQLTPRTPSIGSRSCSSAGPEGPPTITLSIPTMELLSTSTWAERDGASADGYHSPPARGRRNAGADPATAATAGARLDAPAPEPRCGSGGDVAASAARPIAAAGGVRSCRLGAAAASVSVAVAAHPDGGGGGGGDLSSSAGGMCPSPLGLGLRHGGGARGRPASSSAMHVAPPARAAAQPGGGASSLARLAAGQPAGPLYRGSHGFEPPAQPRPHAGGQGPASLPPPESRSGVRGSLDSSCGGGAAGAAPAPFAGPAAQQSALGSLRQVRSGLSGEYGDRGVRPSIDGTAPAASGTLAQATGGSGGIGVGWTLACALAAQYELAAVPGPPPPSSPVSAAAGGAGAAGAGGAGAPVGKKAEARCVAFRGLRVRIGLSSGVDSAADVCRNAASGRMAYSGYPLRLAKAVADAAHGGMVLLSEAARWELLQHEGAAKALAHVLVLWMGRHALSGDLKDTHLFQVVTRPLAVRLPLQRPLRSQELLSPLAGALSAPVHTGALARLAVVGAGTLLAWDYELASYALDILYDALLEDLTAVQASYGCAPWYVVEGAFGLSGPRAKTLAAAAAAAAIAAGGSGRASGGDSTAGEDDVFRTFSGSGYMRSGGGGGSAQRQRAPTSPSRSFARLSSNLPSGGALAPLVPAGAPVADVSGHGYSSPIQRRHRSSMGEGPPLRPSWAGASSVDEAASTTELWRHHSLRPPAPGGAARRTPRALPKAASMGGAVGDWGAGGGGGGRQGVMTLVVDDCNTAAAWLLRALDLLPCLDWPPELLQHPLCEEVAFDEAVVVGSAQSSLDMVRHRLQAREDVRTQQQEQQQERRSARAATAARGGPTAAAAGGGEAPGGCGGAEAALAVEGGEAAGAAGGDAEGPRVAGAGAQAAVAEGAPAGTLPAGAAPSADASKARQERAWLAPAAPRAGILFRGLRARGALSYGELGGELAAGFGPNAGQVAYRGKAWSALGRLGAKSKAGEVTTNAYTASLLAPQLTSLIVVKNA